MAAQTQDKDYKKKIADLLSNYEDGWDIFKKAHDWTYPARLKPGIEDSTLPQSWLELVERVQSIIAHDKYGLNTYENTIAIVDSEQMLDMYTSHGMPYSYQHWSYGKMRYGQQKAYEKGYMGLAYEIVINTNPAIAYCMSENTKTMQMLVIAHASFGHNHFFKNNHLFRQFTRADDIEADLKRLKLYVEECEVKYGQKRVEQLLDACHALELYGIDRTSRPPRRTPEEEAERRERIREARRRAHDPVLDSVAPRSLKGQFNTDDMNKKPLVFQEENLLRSIAATAPHLEPWERKIIHMICDRSQYFYPQMQTQVMNEGCATKMHLEIMRTMHEMQLIDDGMALEVEASTANVITQRDHDQPGFDGRFNPYALGLAICNDIERMCKNPTAEDRQWFPTIAGSGDYMAVLRDMWANYRDEDAILQFMSPKVMRDFKMFAVVDDDEDDMIGIDSIADKDGYRRIQDILSSNYRLSDNQIGIDRLVYDHLGDRSLTIVHQMHNRKPVEEKNLKEVLKHLHRMWGHPVIFKSVNEDMEVEATLACPPDAKGPALPKPNGP